jgi:DNA-binding transcriptional regulator of glucitol operon
VPEAFSSAEINYLFIFLFVFFFLLLLFLLSWQWKRWVSDPAAGSVCFVVCLEM